MDEQTLAREFTAAVRTEPPLGFDPDEVVTRVARRRHRRRTILLACAGVVVAAAAVAVAIPGPEVQAPPASPAAPPRITPSAGDRWWPPGTGDIPQPTDARLSARAPQVADHLETILRKIMPPADGIRREFNDSGRFGGILPASQRGIRTVEQGGRENGSYLLAVNVYVPANPVKRFQPRELCAEMKKQISTSTTCRYADVGTGGVLMTTEEDTTDRAGTTQHRITVTDFRADGTYVLATVANSTGVSGPLPLTAEQLTTVATDPGLTL